MSLKPARRCAMPTTFTSSTITAWARHSRKIHSSTTVPITRSSALPGTSPKNRLYYKDLNDPSAPVVKLLDDFDAEYHFIDNDGPVFWIKTDLEAPRGRLIAIDTRHPERAHWKTLVPQSADKLEHVNVINDKFVLGYLKDAQTEVRLFDLEGNFLRTVDLPGIGTAEGFGGKRKDKETFYAFTSFIDPTTIYRYDFSAMKSSVF